MSEPAKRERRLYLNDMTDFASKVQPYSHNKIISRACQTL